MLRYRSYGGVLVFAMPFYQGWNIDGGVFVFAVSFYKGLDIYLIVLFLCLLCHFTKVWIFYKRWNIDLMASILRLPYHITKTGIYLMVASFCVGCHYTKVEI